MGKPKQIDPFKLELLIEEEEVEMLLPYSEALNLYTLLKYYIQTSGETEPEFLN